MKTSLKSLKNKFPLMLTAVVALLSLTLFTLAPVYVAAQPAGSGIGGGSSGNQPGGQAGSGVGSGNGQPDDGTGGEAGSGAGAGGGTGDNDAAGPAGSGVFCPEGTSGTPENPCVNPDVKDIKEQAEESNPNKITCGNQADCGGVISGIVNPMIRIVTGTIGLIIVISLVAAAIMYSAAGGDPSKVSAAKKRITNTIIALLAYLFTFGLLQWLIPGGVV